MIVTPENIIILDITENELGGVLFKMYIHVENGLLMALSLQQAIEVYVRTVINHKMNHLVYYNQFHYNDHLI